MSVDLLKRYFPELEGDERLDQLAALPALYTEWNAKINVISRKDIENIYLRHIIHSLTIAKFIHFKEGADVMDLGTGGGFPGIPLAIYFPETRFTLIDGTKKKIHVVNEVSSAVGLRNVKAKQLRAEECKQKFDFIVTRAVATVDKLMLWGERLIKTKHQHALPNGIIALKGGDLSKETSLLGDHHYYEYIDLRELIDEELFDEKYLMYIQG